VRLKQKFFWVAMFCWCFIQCPRLTAQAVIHDRGHYQMNNLIKHDWQANWIGPNYYYPNTFWRYHKDVSLRSKPQSAIAFIATDSKYYMWINDSLVIFDGQLKRGPTPKDTYYDEVDLTPYLKKGINTIDIVSWYWGKDGFCHKSSNVAGLLFECKADKVLIISDPTWKIFQDQAFQNSLPPHPNFRLPEHNIRYDARMATYGWMKMGKVNIPWQKPKIIGRPGQPPFNQLWKRPIPLWYDSGLKTYASQSVDKDGRYIADLGNNLTITPYFKIKALPGRLIDIRTDNYYGGSEPNIRTEYITKGGVQEFETPAYLNGHKVIYTFPKDVEVIDLKYRESKYNTEYVSTFKCNDPFYNTLRQKAANTLNVNMRDGIQDPDRERAQWWGDVVIILEEIFYTTDSRGILAIQKAISNLFEWQRADSVLFSPNPAGNWNVELPAQMLASIGEYGLGKYIEYTGDTAIISHLYPKFKKYMDLWKIDEDGMVIHRSGGWDWHDWGDKIDVRVLDNAWFYLALKTQLKMAKHLNLSSDINNLVQMMKTIEAGFYRNFWKGNRFASVDYKYFADDRAQGMAVVAGLVTRDQWDKLMPILDTTFYAGPYLEKYILEAYFIMGAAKKGQDRMKKRYQAMVDHPTIKTLWEGWEIGSSTYGGGTYNHGWTGGPLSIMSKYMAGIYPTSSAYDTYEIKPQLGHLKEVFAKVLTKNGWVSNDIKIHSGKMTMTVETINGNATIYVPKINDTSTLSKIPPDLVMTEVVDDYWIFNTDKLGKFTFEVSL
jgi:hypothetical protein